MNTDSSIRVALIGYGMAGSLFHAPLIAATPGMRLTSVFTTDAQRAAQASARFSGVQTIEDLELLWAQRPDLVVFGLCDDEVGYLMRDHEAGDPEYAYERSMSPSRLAGERVSAAITGR